MSYLNTEDFRDPLFIKMRTQQLTNQAPYFGHLGKWKQPTCLNNLALILQFLVFFLVFMIYLRNICVEEKNKQ